MPTYRIKAGGLHEKFLQSRAKVQFIGGGFGNGKTAATCIKCLMFAKDYPGSNGLIARSTYPKLNDTIRREFFKWCPKEWIDKAPTKDDNTVYLKNGTTINFRYAQQRGTDGNTTSNLLSATYDWIAVDQIEDPEFSHRDFQDLMGRLRGNTPYRGDDTTMPRMGPRMMILTSNPTRNWVFREIVQPLLDFKEGRLNPRLLCEVDLTGKALVKGGKPVPVIELFSGGTEENMDNVGEDYIRGMLSTFTNESMKKRFISGEWTALEGLIYPQYDSRIHTLSQETILSYYRSLREVGVKPFHMAGYDHGIRVPSAYLMSFGDDDGNIFVFDGFYQANLQVRDIAEQMQALHDTYSWMLLDKQIIHADPDLFRRKMQGGGAGQTVADLFTQEGIVLAQGSNAITAGINKVGQYLTAYPRHDHPLFGTPNAPYLYFSDTLDFLDREIVDYYFKDASKGGQQEDKPNDKNDHAMDALKYLLTGRPQLAKVYVPFDKRPQFLQWQEIESGDRQFKPRHR